MTRSKGATTLEVIPSAKRLVHSLRDIGYDFASAVADLVDNSIAAGATLVAIELRFAGAESWIRITDNGCGMSGQVLTEAMRYGSSRDYDEHDLGKFGLGLKTASMSQCRRLTVATRASAQQRRIEVRQLDLDHIERKDRWEVFDLRTADCISDLTVPLDHKRGTVVLWEQLDRVFNYKVPDGERAKAGMRELAEMVDKHLAMVFHRFLAGEASRKKKLVITVNGTMLEPWDPFCRGEDRTEKLKRLPIELDTTVGAGVVTFTPFVLPPKHHFSSDSEFNRAGGPNKWNRQQGLYIYREDRLIQSGGWSHMRVADEHTKIARAALDFGRELDAAFGVNVAKMRVNLPPELKSQLDGPISQLAGRAQVVYRRKLPTPNAPVDGSARTSEGGGVETRAEAKVANGHAGRPASPRPGSYKQALQVAARAVGENDALKRIMREVGRRWPEVADDLGY